MIAPPPPRASDGVVYFIRAENGLIKIGATKNLDSRWATFVRTSPAKLEWLFAIPGGFPVESEIHGVLRNHWSHGEWFRPDPEVLALIESRRVFAVATRPADPVLVQKRKPLGSRITNEGVADIFRALEAGETMKAIASRLGVSRGYVGAIAAGRERTSALRVLSSSEAA